MCALFKRNLERKKQLQYNIQLQKCKNMMMLPRHPFPSHSPHHAYMHETVHLEPPQTWKKQPAKNKESTKSYKNLLNQCSFKSNLVIWKRKKATSKNKASPKLQKCFKSILFKKEFRKKKQLQYNIQLQKTQILQETKELLIHTSTETFKWKKQPAKRKILQKTRNCCTQFLFQLNS